MKVISTRLGELEITEEDTIYFPEGILGFPEYKKYAWIVNKDQESPIELLQSIDDADLTFIITDPFLFKSDYTFDLQAAWEEKLGINKHEQLVVRVIVTVRNNNQTSINLKAPLIINIESNNSAQIILDKPEYTLQYLIGGGEQLASTYEG